MVSHVCHSTHLAALTTAAASSFVVRSVLLRLLVLPLILLAFEIHLLEAYRKKGNAAIQLAVRLEEVRHKKFLFGLCKIVSDQFEVHESPHVSSCVDFVPCRRLQCLVVEVV